MKLNKLIKFLFMLSLVIVVIILSCQNPESSSSGGDSGGSDNDQNEKELANGVYAKLIIARIITEISGTTYKMDSVEAVFSDYYDPCAVISDLQPTSVSCLDASGTNYDLIFFNNMYLYNDPTDIDGFLKLGLKHEFDVDASIEVPALTTSIDLPAVEPTIITPVNNSIVQKSNNLDITWNGTTGGSVSVVLISVNNPSELISVETSDNGSYTFNSTQLSSLSSGQYYLHVERFNEEFIIASGYDDRSIIRARILSSVLINLTD